MLSLIPRERSSMFNAVAGCWRNWKRSRSNIFDLKDCSADEITRIADYLGISPAELRCIASYSPDRANLLQRRMAALGLDWSDLARTDPGTWHDLERLCAACDSRGRCALDLAGDFANTGSVDWTSYCPNAATLGSLTTLCGRTAQVKSTRVQSS